MEYLLYVNYILYYTTCFMSRDFFKKKRKKI